MPDAFSSPDVQPPPDQGPPPDSASAPDVPPALGGSPFNLAQLTPPPVPGQADAERARFEKPTRMASATPPNPQTIQPRPPDPQQGKPPPTWPPKWVPNRRQFYMPVRGHRGPSAWGMPRQFPMLPAPWQAPDVLMGVGAQMSQMLPPALAMMAFGLNRYTRAFMDGLHKGQREFAKQHRDHAKHHGKHLNQQTQQMLDSYRDAFAQNSDPQDQQQLEQDIEAIAQRYNDQKMLARLHNEGIQGVVNQLNMIDAKHGDLRAALQTQADEDARLEASNPFMTSPTNALGMSVARQKPPFSVTPDPVTTPAKPVQLAGAMPTPGAQQQPRVQNDPQSYGGSVVNPKYQPQPEYPGGGPDLETPEQAQDERGPDIRPMGQDTPEQIPTFKKLAPSEEPPEPGTDSYFEGPDVETREASRNGRVRLAQADTGTATDAPPPEAAAAADKRDPNDPFEHAWTRSTLRDRGVLKGGPAAAAEQKPPTLEDLHKQEQERVAAEEQQAPLEMTPALTAIKQKNPGVDLRTIDGLARRKMLGQLSAAQEKQLDKAGLLDAVNQRSLELDRTVDDILKRAQSGELSRDQVLEEIRKKLGPRMASDVQSVLNGQDLGKSSLAKAPWDKIIPLAQAVDPSINPITLKNRQRVMGYYLAGQGNGIIVSGAHTIEVGEDLEKELGNQPSYAAMKAYEALRKVNRKLADATFPEEARKISSIQAGAETFVADAQKIFAAGRPTQQERLLMAEKINWDEPEKARALIAKYVHYLNLRMADHKREWMVGTKGAPGTEQMFNEMLGRDPAVKRVWDRTKAGAKPIEQIEGGFQDRAAPEPDAPGGDYQDVPGHPGVRMRQVR